MYYKERKMTSNLSNIKKQLTPKQRSQISKYIESYIIGYRKALMTANSDSVVVAFHKEIDGLIAKTLKSTERQISCTKGCSFCCNRQITISEDEGKLLLKYCKDQGIDIDWSKLAKQEGLRPESFVDVLKFVEAQCVFVGDKGECKVYEHRPSICRNHMVTSPKKECDMVKGMDNKMDYLIADFAEVVASAMFHCSPTGKMADVLIKLNKEQSGNFLKKS